MIQDRLENQTLKTEMSSEEDNEWIMLDLEYETQRTKM